MKILILGHPKEDGTWTDAKFHPNSRAKIPAIKHEGLLDLVNTYAERYHRDTYVEDINDDPLASIKIEEPLKAEQLFMWDDSLFTFIDNDSLALTLSHTGEGILQRFVDSIEFEKKEKQDSNNFYKNFVSWSVEGSTPFGYKSENLLPYSQYLNKKKSLSPDNFWVTKKILKIILGGNEFYVKGMTIYYDEDDEDVMFALNEGDAKPTILNYISEHDSEMKPQPIEEPIEENEPENQQQIP